jgi:molybdate-binding protein
LQLANALGCRVDDLFGLPQAKGIEALLTPFSATETRHPTGAKSRRVHLARVRDHWVAHRLVYDSQAADGLLVRTDDHERRALIRPLVDLAHAERSVLVAGCAPLLGLLAQRTGFRHRDVRVTWLPANSRRALDLFEAGFVHVAGLHLVDKRTRQDNIPLLRRRFPERSIIVVNLTRWQQGLVVPSGNPLAVKGADDLLRPGLRFARREKGSGARQLAQRVLTAGGGPKVSTLPGPDAFDHVDVANLVRCGAADVGIAIEGAAIHAGLHFVPLAEERFDLIVSTDVANCPPVSGLLETLTHPSFRTELQCLPGYDGSICGHTTTLVAT